MTEQYVSLSYWKATKHIYYSMLFIFPMLLLYEAMCWIQFKGIPTEIRNGADVLIRQLIMGYGKYSESIYGIILLIVCLSVMFINCDVVKNGRLKINFLFYMLVESFLWSLGFIILISISENLLLSILDRNIVPEQFYLAIGAGIWEELLFRFGVIGLSLTLLRRIIGYSGIFSAILAVVFAAVLFSLFHYLGAYGDIFTFKTFYIRTMAGIFLGLLYLLRGLGITVYTHIFYDIMIISMPIIFTKV